MSKSKESSKISPSHLTYIRSTFFFFLLFLRCRTSSFSVSSGNLHSYATSLTILTTLPPPSAYHIPHPHPHPRNPCTCRRQRMGSPHLHPLDFVVLSLPLSLPLPSFIFFFFLNIGAIQIRNTTEDSGDPCGTPTLHEPFPLTFPSHLTSNCRGRKKCASHWLHPLLQDLATAFNTSCPSTLLSSPFTSSTTHSTCPPLANPRCALVNAHVMASSLDLPLIPPSWPLWNNPASCRFVGNNLFLRAYRCSL